MNPFYDQAPENRTDDVPRVVPHTSTPTGAAAAFTTVSSWDRGYVALDSQTRGIFIVAASHPQE